MHDLQWEQKLVSESSKYSKATYLPASDLGITISSHWPTVLCLEPSNAARLIELVRIDLSGDGGQRVQY
jgi:hypothetical protein